MLFFETQGLAKQDTAKRGRWQAAHKSAGFERKPPRPTTLQSSCGLTSMAGSSGQTRRRTRLKPRTGPGCQVRRLPPQPDGALCAKKLTTGRGADYAVWRVSQDAADHGEELRGGAPDG